MRQIPWRVERLDGCWIGVCESLKLTVESGTRSELVDDIVNAMEDTILSLRKAGDPEGVLENLEDRELHLAIDIPFMSAIDASQAASAHC